MFSYTNYSTLSLDSDISVTPYRLCKVRRSTCFFGWYLVLYTLSLAFGAFVFAALEQPIEMELKHKLSTKIQAFKDEHLCVDDADLEELIVEILEASTRGVSAIKNVSSEPNWSFGQSFFFSSTIVTTIGYGHVHPLSEAGKIFCIIYAVIGIPMTFMLLTALVERLLVPTTWLLHWMNSKLGHLYQPFNIRVFHLGVVAGTTVVMFLIVPALVFEKLEPGWNFLDAVYYCFISLTTIGLGDYIPGDAREQRLRPLYKLCITGYLLIGLTFVMLLLHLYNDIPQLNVGLFLLSRSDVPNDPERMRLSGAAGAARHKYSQNDQTVMQNVKVVSRPVDSPSPEEDTTPVHAKLPPIMSTH